MYDPESRQVPGGPSNEELTKHFAGVYGPPRSRFRYIWFDENYNELGDITRAVLSASVSVDNFRAIPRTGQLEVTLSAWPEAFDTKLHLIGFFADLQVGTEWIRFPRGMFYIDRREELIRLTSTQHGTKQDTWTISLSDIMLRAFETNIERTYVVPAGVKYTDKISEILDTLGMRHSIPDLPYVTPVILPPFKSSIAWGAVLSDLAEAINCFPPYPLANGIVTTRERTDPAEEVPVAVYTTREEPRMIRPGTFRRTVERGRFINRAVVRLSDPLRTQLSVDVINEDEDSPVSTVTKGRIARTDATADLSPGVDTMLDIAAWLVRDASVRAQAGQLGTHDDFRRDMHESYTITFDDREEESLWRANAWSAGMTPGSQMSHNIGRALRVDITQSICL